MGNNREALMTHGRPLFVTYDRAFSLIRHLEPEVGAYAPELIVGILRSGLIPALMLSQRLTLPVAFCACNRGDRAARFIEPPDLLGKRVLVVDDFATTGATLAKVGALLHQWGADYKSMTIFYDEHLVSPPDFGHKAAQFIQFVWDKLEVTPSSRRLFKTQGSRYAPDAVEEHFGVDIDGMILNQPGALLDKLEAHLLRKPGASIVLVTAHAASEVRARLVALGLSDFAVVGADTQSLATACKDNIVVYKAQQIRRCGISTFYEGDTAHALGIAQACPMTDVVLWNSGAPMRISVDTL